MKKTIVVTSFLIIGLLFHGSCSKEEDSGDGTPPVIEMLGSNPLYWALNIEFVDPGAKAYDINQNGDTVDITSSITAISTVDISTQGDYTVTYSVTDDSGLSAEEKVRSVKVLVGK